MTKTVAVKEMVVFDPWDKKLNPYGDDNVAEALSEDVLELDKLRNNERIWIEDMPKSRWMTDGSVVQLAVDRLDNTDAFCDIEDEIVFHAYVSAFVKECRTLRTRIE